MEANERMQEAIQQVGEVHAAGGSFQAADAEAAPTGATYKEARAAEEAKANAQREARMAADEAARFQMQERKVAQAVRTLDDVDSDDELVDDPELASIRAARIKQLRQQHTERLSNMARGHGEYREIVEDEFLASVTSSRKVIVHFYTDEFMRCRVMDKHLALLAPRHVEARFLKMDANKSPFFVAKLQIRVLPTVVMFVDGVAVDRIVGFEGLIDEVARGAEDEWPTSALEERLSADEFLDYVAPSSSSQERWDAPRSNVYSGVRRTEYSEDDF